MHGRHIGSACKCILCTPDKIKTGALETTCDRSPESLVLTLLITGQYLKQVAGLSTNVLLDLVCFLFSFILLSSDCAGSQPQRTACPCDRRQHWAGAHCRSFASTVFHFRSDHPSLQAQGLPDLGWRMTHLGSVTSKPLLSRLKTLRSWSCKCLRIRFF